LEDGQQPAALQELEPRIRAEQNRELFQRLGGILISSLAGVAVLATIYWPLRPTSHMLAWIGLYALVTLARLWLKRAWKADPEKIARAGTWSRRFDLLTALSGAFWGSTAWLLFRGDAPQHDALLHFVIAGLVAGSVVNFAVRWQAAWLLVVPALAPFFYRFSTLDAPMAAETAAMIAVFGAVMLFMSLQLSRQHANRIRTQLKHERDTGFFRAQQQRYRSLVESTRAIIWEGRPGSLEFSYISPEVETLLGYPVGKWLDDPHFWVEHMHPEDRAWVPAQCEALTRKQQDHAFDYRMIAADGRVIWLRDVVNVVSAEDEVKKVVGVMIDISEIKESEQTLKSMSGMRQLMVELSRKFIRSSEPDIDGALSEMLEQIGRWCEVDRAYVIRFSPDHDQYSNTHEWVAPGIKPEIANLQGMPSSTAPNIIARLQQHERVLLTDIEALDEQWAPEKEMCRLQGIRSLISLPIFSNGRLVGLVGCDCVNRRHTWSKEEASLMQVLGDLLGEALARAGADGALRESEAMRASAETLAGMGSWEWLIDEDVLVVSEEWRKVTGCYRDPLRSSDLLPLVHAEDLQNVQAALEATLVTGCAFDVEYRLSRMDDGQATWVKAHAELIQRDGRPHKLRGFLQDISERRRVQEELYELAHYDALTGLPNRVLAADRLGQALNRARRSDQRVAAFFMDLDEFKKVNDTLGHEAGDRVLVEAARRLSGLLREEDTVARISGDEFLVIVEGFAEVTELRAVADKMLDAFRSAIAVDGREFMLTGSIGIAVFPQDGGSVDELMRSADTAMYHAKRDGGDSGEFFTRRMNQLVERQHALEEAMRGALERGEMAVHYQPVIDLAQGRIMGAEALLRWRHPLLGNVGPHEFIPVAELSGQVKALGEFVLREASATARQWRERVGGSFHVSINVSPHQFRDPAFADTVIAMLGAHGLPGEALEIEITEGVLLSGIDNVHETLNVLQSAGVGIAMDDFGTGYASLSYLRDYPFSSLKIDRGFVMQMDQDPRSRELVVSAVRLAQSLGMKVIAEGIETERQLRMLREEGCRLGQGFLFSPAVDEEAFDALVRGEIELSLAGDAAGGDGFRAVG